MLDALGRELKIGDHVAMISKSDTRAWFDFAEVIDFTEQKVKVAHITNNHTYLKRTTATKKPELMVIVPAEDITMHLIKK